MSRALAGDCCTPGHPIFRNCAIDQLLSAIATTPPAANLSSLLRLGHSLRPRALITSSGSGSCLICCQPVHGVSRGCIMRRSLFSVVVLIVACTRIEAACIDPSMFVQSTMSIARHFNEDERKAQPGVIGIRGTAWFLSSRSLVTAAHVAEAMQLSAHERKDVELQNGEGKRSVSVRVLHLAGLHAEKIAVLELDSAIPNA